MPNRESNNDYLKRALQSVTNLGKTFARNQLLRLSRRLLVFLGRKVILGGIKVVLAKTAPIWGSLLLILAIAFLAFSLIYAMPRMVAEDASATGADRVAAFFGFSDKDAEGYEDIFDTYQDIANEWDDGLNSHQKKQVGSYAFSWAVLAGVDRMRNDPFIKDINAETIMIDGSEIVVDGLYPPSQFIPIYKAAEREYGVDWEILASIHYHESTYSTFPTGGVSSAGAQGPMQFMPATWDMYGVDATGTGKADIWNDIDAIHSAANYLKASGYHRNIRSAIFAYNRADWYVNMIVRDAELIRQLEIDQESIEREYDEEGKERTFKFITLGGDPNLITPKPRETFEILRPVFEWKDSTITKRWTETRCSTDENGERYCYEVQMESIEDIKLLTSAHTFEGTYSHEYEWSTEVTSGGVTVIQEVNTAVNGPSEDEYMQPFYEYLEGFNITRQIDIDTTVELIGIFDPSFAESKELRDKLYTDNYPVIEGSNGWIWPTPSTRITSGFGPRTSPCAGCSSFHKGVDTGALTPGVAGDPVYAAADGTVISSAYSGSAGNMIVIDHGDGISTRYLHLDRRFVNGGRVKKGEIIGTMGSTGVGTNVHLHFEILINNEAHDPLYYYPNVK